jgi:hypothetical protein
MAASMPSVRPLLKAGDILMRDPRVWHRGTPSNGTRSRPNLALVYSRGWFRFENHPVRIKIPRATYTAFDDKLKKMCRYCAILEEDGQISDVQM